VLIARIRTVLKRKSSSPDQSAPLTIAIFAFTPAMSRIKGAYRFNFHGISILRFWPPNRMGFSRYQIVDAIKGEDYAVTDVP
jgi:hypothetical protein